MQQASLAKRASFTAKRANLDNITERICAAETLRQAEAENHAKLGWLEEELAVL